MQQANRTTIHIQSSSPSGTNDFTNSSHNNNYTHLDNPSRLRFVVAAAAGRTLNEPINKDSNINSLNDSNFNFRPSRVPHLQQPVQDNHKDMSNDPPQSLNNISINHSAGQNSTRTVATTFPFSDPSMELPVTTINSPDDDEDSRLHFKTDAVPLLSNRSTGFPQSTSPASPRSVTFLSKLMTKLGLNACPESPPDLIGPLEANLSQDTIADVENRFKQYLLPGGWYRPNECNAKDRVAIIIPFRDREEHLPVLLKNLHPMLMRQQVNYGIFVVEETKADPFNRASLMNVGFLEANKLDNWDCFIFHDVDLIPLDDRNLYRCPEQPRHMSVSIDVFDYK